MNKQLFLILFLVSVCYGMASPQISSQKYLTGTNITGITSHNDYLWISTYGQGVYRYSYTKNKWKSYTISNDNSIGNNFFYCIAAGDNYIWAGGADGLYILDLKRDHWRRRKFALGGEMGNWIRALAFDSTKNVLWIGRFENLTKLDVRMRRYTDHVLTQDGNTKTNNIKSIRFDGDSLVWFGTESGVFKYRKNMPMNNPAAWQFIDNKNGGFMDEGDAVSISDMVFERDEVWFGTDEFISEEHPRFNVGGIYIFDRKRNWISINTSNGLPANGIYCLARTGNYIWAGIYDFDKKEKKDYGQGLVIINRFSTTVTPIDLDEINIQSAKINTMFFDGNDMWLGTDNGLCRVVIQNAMARWPEQKENHARPKTKGRRR